MPEYVLATDADFTENTFGDFIYVGADEYVEIPHVIKGVDVTAYSHMFSDRFGASVVKGVKSTNKNVTIMSFMFNRFQGANVELNLDISNVEYMTQMFMDSQLTVLDLSSFDTSNKPSMMGIFEGSQATTGYARTQADADRFNATSGKPSTLTFVVKPPKLFYNFGGEWKEIATKEYADSVLGGEG